MSTTPTHAYIESNVTNRHTTSASQRCVYIRKLRETHLRSHEEGGRFWTSGETFHQRVCFMVTSRLSLPALLQLVLLLLLLFLFGVYRQLPVLVFRYCHLVELICPADKTYTRVQFVPFGLFIAPVMSLCSHHECITDIFINLWFTQTT